METEKPQFDLISLGAPGVFGFPPFICSWAHNRAPVERPGSLKEIGGSSAIFLQNLDPNLKEFPKTWSAFYIDVRDCALAHVRAAFAPAEAGNQRYLVAGPGVGTNKMVLLSRRIKLISDSGVSHQTLPRSQCGAVKQRGSGGECETNIRRDKSYKDVRNRFPHVRGRSSRLHGFRI